MRREFFTYLYENMCKNPSIIAVTGDLGMGGFDRIRDNLPNQFINVGAAEQSALDVAVGLALDGKKPFVYSITPFLLYRGFETIRTYIDHESIPVRLIGSGRNKDYKHDGFSHYAGDDKKFIKKFKNISCFWPSNNIDMYKCVDAMIEVDKPYYLNLSR